MTISNPDRRLLFIDLGGLALLGFTAAGPAPRPMRWLRSVVDGANRSCCRTHRASSLGGTASAPAIPETATESKHRRPWYVF